MLHSPLYQTGHRNCFILMIVQLSYYMWTVPFANIRCKFIHKNRHALVPNAGCEVSREPEIVIIAITCLMSKCFDSSNAWNMIVNSISRLTAYNVIGIKFKYEKYRNYKIVYSNTNTYNAKDLRQDYFRYRVFASRHQAIGWSNAALSSNMFSGIHPLS